MKRAAATAAHATLLLALVVCAADCKRPETEALARGTLALRLRGAAVATWSGTDVRKLGARRIVVEDPHEHRDLEVIGVPAEALFDAAFGPSWRTADDVIATCADGFHPSIPVRQFLLREGYLAYARPDARDFTVKEEPGKNTPVGPYYLVWKKAKGEDSPEPMWPYKVTGLEVTDFAARYAAAFPPADATPLAREGFERFRTFCLPCHTINGSGGDVGPELNFPVSVTEYFAEPVLRRWLGDPRQIRWNAKMPPPLPDDARRAHSIDALVAYLKAMTSAKRAPDSGTSPPDASP